MSYSVDELVALLDHSQAECTARCQEHVDALQTWASYHQQELGRIQAVLAQTTLKGC